MTHPAVLRRFDAHPSRTREQRRAAPLSGHRRAWHPPRPAPGPPPRCATCPASCSCWSASSARSPRPACVRSRRRPAPDCPTSSTCCGRSSSASSSATRSACPRSSGPASHRDERPAGQTRDHEPRQPVEVGVPALLRGRGPELRPPRARPCGPATAGRGGAGLVVVAACSLGLVLLTSGWLTG